MADGEYVMSNFTIVKALLDGNPVFAVREDHILRGCTESVPMAIVGVAETLEAARNIVPIEADTCFIRSLEDHPDIIETWI